MSDHLHSFMSIVHSDGLGQFQHVNATPHVLRVATKSHQEHSSDFRHFHCPPKSPDMNIIEDISGMPYYILLRRDLHHLALPRIC
ncbi:hypothetical protein AVEN_206409-1 [Araneus ventricosus]|uniref:Uncharacterized protein n=1 Tax=Araneus ventricosus TaxID=182803 RepID=A0A4Y2EK13_ARAVE|nr:hypothetical protein AVEN_206409-1 [Araneus ventricosus]